ncbi:hypothetical protein HF313_00685 [Massilia atriviolacea]|uniref:Uncharacterized protein n=1 Tax=Massilia atriviolacea TaxID=2495579 RepID=A0A430HL68_9BURK|nr:hypothetical protein [Massilia atriviolacea]RSZ58250.1 hypothetical protein EJB06_14915 [Massilia atriviolacea]
MRQIPATALLAVMLVLGACGGDDDPPAAPSRAPALAAAAPAPGPARSVPAPSPPPPPPLRTAPPPGTPAPTDLAQLRQEVASLRREVAELRMILTRAPLPAQPAGALAVPLTTDTPAVAPAETMFRAEPVDHAWSNQASAAVRAALARTNGELETQVRRLECRTRTCRIEVNPASADQLESAMPAVLANLGATLPNMTATQVGSDDGSAATVLYLTR